MIDKKTPTPNDQRATVKNPTSEAHKADKDNKSVQGQTKSKTDPKTKK